MNDMTQQPVVETNPIEEPQESPKPTEQRKNLVKELTGWCLDTAEFWKETFNHIRKNQRRVCGSQWGEPEFQSDEKQVQQYQCNFMLHSINNAKANLYAQNPTLKCIRRPRLNYAVWDGSQEQLEQAKAEVEIAAQMAMQQATAGGPVQPPPAQASAIVADYQQGMQTKKLLDRIAETIEILITKQLDLQTPDFESEMKQAVIREKISRVSFVAVKFERVNETVATSSATTTSPVDALQVMSAKAEKLADDSSPDDAGHEELQLMSQSFDREVQEGKIGIKYERLVFDFKPTTSILVDRNCRNLREFVGAQRVAEQLFMTPEQIYAQWGVDVKQAGTVQYSQDKMNTDAYTVAGGPNNSGGVAGSTFEWAGETFCRVFVVHDKNAQMKYTVCEGFDDFLEEPEAPWPAVPGFWHIAALKFVDVEVEANDPKNDVTCYGKCDADLMWPMQAEVNRTQEGLRQHRIASRPAWMAAKNAFSEGDKKNLGGHLPCDVIIIDNLLPEEDIRKKLMAKPVIPIDPALYNMESLMNQVALVSGAQSANIGEQQPDETATGQAITEQSRIQTVSSDVDSQDKFLNVLMRIASVMAFMEFEKETVLKLVGPGAVWPELRRGAGGEQQPGVITRDDCIEQLLLQVEAASSGRANKAVEVNNFEKMFPLLGATAQQYGLDMRPIIKYGAKLMDFRYDLDEWFASKPMMQMPGNVTPLPASGESGNTNPAAANPSGMKQPALTAASTRMLPK